MFFFLTGRILYETTASARQIIGGGGLRLGLKKVTISSRSIAGRESFIPTKGKGRKSFSQPSKGLYHLCYVPWKGGIETTLSYIKSQNNRN